MIILPGRSGFDAEMQRVDQFLFGPGRRMRRVTNAQMDEISHQTLIAWANLRGRYVLPTAELIEWLRARIAGRSVLEVGAGFGDLGHLLGIRMTDSAMQQRPEMLAMYARMGQVAINPPPDVERLEAVEAVEKYKPQVVIAGFLTQAYQPGDEQSPKVGSSVFGTDEKRIIDQVEEYIHIGAWAVHRDKRARDIAYEEIAQPWIRTRAIDPNRNVIWSWRDH